MAIFGAVALFLAVVGIYAIMAQFVTQRTRELGIRMALGAQRLDVLWLVSQQGLKLTLIGVAIGLVAAYNLSQLLSGYIFGISPTDLSTFVLTPLLLIVSSLLACYIPIRRAVKVDPMVALRYE
jgi:ABC-type antimicrobial peptide transport system permease subunit